MASSSLYKLLLICYLILLGCTLAENANGVTWLFPTQGQTLHYEDTINATWTSPFPSPLLYTFCYNSTNNGLIQEAFQSVTPYNGSQLIQLVWQGISSCNFDLRPNTTAGHGANSPVFFVLPSAGAVATTVGLSSPSSTSSASSTMATLSSTSTAASTSTGPGEPTGTSKTPSSSGLSSGAKAGIGVAVAVGAIAAIAGLAFFFLRRRRSKNPPPHSTTTAGNAEDSYGGQQYRQVDSTTESEGQMQEMNAAQEAKPAELSSNVAHELPGFDVGRR